MKKNVKKVILTVLAVVLVFGCGVGATLAWLVAQTNTVTNTFAVGNIAIDLQETVGTTGKQSAKLDSVTNNNFKIVPGASEAKDPTVIVEAGSEKCYVYVCVENNLVVNGKTVGTLDINTSTWEVIGTQDNKTVYRYYEVVDAANDKADLPVFTTVSYDKDISVGDMTILKDKTVVISAYAHQSEHVDNGTTTTDAEALAYFELSTSNS
jgi:hypothetical protein